VPDVALDICEDLLGVGLIPAPVQVLGRNTKLNNEIAGQVLGFDFAPLLSPEPKKGNLVLAHNDVGV
jgi:hypothetical protein